jgi:hypothetical protein
MDGLLDNCISATFSQWENYIVVMETDMTASGIQKKGNSVEMM